MNRVELRVQRLREDARLPLRASPQATGLDLFASLEQPLVLTATPQLVTTGIAIEVPPGFDAQVRPRSGLSLRGVGVAFGTIDADYRGEVMVTMWTFGGLEHTVADGDRIAQLVVAALAPVDVVEAADLSASTRGSGGHGSTGR